MKILIDLQSVQTSSRHRGIGRYSLQLTEAILSLPHEHEVYIALSHLQPNTIEPLRDHFANLLPSSHIITWQAPGAVSEKQSENYQRCKMGEFLRESFLASLKPDIVYVSSLFEGFAEDALTSINSFEKLPTGMTLYDLIPLLYKEHYLDSNPSMHRWYERKLMSAKRADLWLAISEASRLDAIQHLQLPEEWVVNISAAVSPFWKKLTLTPEESALLCRRYHLNDLFLMYTTSEEFHKNTQNLILGYAQLPQEIREKYQLVIVGSVHQEKRVTYLQAASNLGVNANQIIFTGYIPDEDLIKIYNICVAFVCPSLYEGFGLPALEAMSCGAAVIGSDTSSLPEVIGCQDALFNPKKVDSITAKLYAVLTDPDFRATLQRHALEQVKKFSWKSSAQRALNAFENLHEQQKYTTTTKVTVNKRPKLAFFSPLPSEKTGIANYSAELLPELLVHYSIDIIVNQEVITDSLALSNCSIKSVDWFKRNAQQYEGRVLYHMGNSVFHHYILDLLKSYPGIVVLHDFYLSGVLKYLEVNEGCANIWTKALYDSHGYEALFKKNNTLDLEDIKNHYPTNFHVLQQATGIITHSKLFSQWIKNWYGSDIKIKSKYIPQLRIMNSMVAEKDAVRKELGFAKDDFLVCSFGFLAPTKLNERLLSAWFLSPLATNPKCHLIFVGENEGGAYGESLLQQINSQKSRQSSRITGFVSEALYTKYMTIADIAVQLRTMSRGETSRAVLDCMAYGLPMILNAHGTMTEYPKDVACFVSENFSDAELSDALVSLSCDESLRESLHEKSMKYLQTFHHPRYVGKKYYDAIEYFIDSNDTFRQLNLMKEIIAENESYSIDPLDLAENIMENEAPIRQKQILIDLSEFVKKDLKTGIERVVRGYLNELLKNPPASYRVEPVYSNEQGIYCYARSFTLNLLDCAEVSELKDDKIEVYQGDIFLSIDLVASEMEHRMKIFKQWRDKGVSLFFVLYDILPINHPEYFPGGMDKILSTWLKNMATVSHGVVTISRTVAEELTVWLNTQQLQRKTFFNIAWMHLAADIKKSFPTMGDSAQLTESLAKIEKNLSILMVGTIEPRKGHVQVLEAFEILWEKGVEINWIIVGKAGWEVNNIIDKLQTHKENNRHLFWFKEASDEVLLALYQKVDGCLLASYGEGFGLPLIEAAQYQLPILARDIPVFREVGGEYVTYFSAESADDLANTLETWSIDLKHNKAISSSEMPWMTWAQSTQKLIDIILKNQWVTHWKPLGITFNQFYDFSHKPDCIEVSGFSGEESWGMWTSATHVSIAIHADIALLSQFPSGYVYFKVQPFVTELLKTQRVNFAWGNAQVLSLDISETQWVCLPYVMADWHENCLNTDRVILIRLTIPDVISPKEAFPNISNDDRLLGLGFIQLLISENIVRLE